jgi:hypothetical protein
MSGQSISRWVLCMALCAWNPSSATGGTLVGLFSVNFDRQLGVIDPASGLVAMLGAPLTGAPLGTLVGANAHDEVGKRFFFVGAPSGGAFRIYSVSTADGALLSAPILSQSTFPVGIQYDPLSSRLFALLKVGFDRQLGVIDPATGSVTLLGGPLTGGVLDTLAGLDALDAVDRRFFFLGNPPGEPLHLYSISISDGSVIFSPQLGGDDPPAELEFDSLRNRLYVVFSVNLDRQLAAVDPVSGAVSFLGPPMTGGVLSTTIGASALDANGRRLFFMSALPDGSSRLISTASTIDGTLIGIHQTSEPWQVLGLEYLPALVGVPELSMAGLGILIATIALAALLNLRTVVARAH